MTQETEPPPSLRYRSYLIRLWLEDMPPAGSLRIIVINPQTGDRRGFVDWQGLVSFLSQELSDQHNPNSPPHQTVLSSCQTPKTTKGEENEHT